MKRKARELSDLAILRPCSCKQETQNKDHLKVSGLSYYISNIKYTPVIFKI